MSTYRRRIALAALPTVLLLLVGCSSGTVAPDVDGPAAAPAPEVVAEVPTVAPGEPSLPLTLTSDDGAEVEVESLERVMVLDDTTIEIAHALGVGETIAIAPETSLVEDLAAQAEERITTSGGALTVEGTVSLQPTLVIGTNLRRTGELISGLRDVGVPAVMIDRSSPAPEQVAKTAEVLGVPEQGAELAAAVQAQYDEADQRLADLTGRPRVLMLSSSGAGDTGNTTAAGADTPVDQVITMAGGINTGAETGLERYQSITAEGLVAAAPEVVLVAESELADLGGEDGIWDQVAGLSATTAGTERRLVVLPDMQVKAAGVSSGVGVLTLLAALHPDR